jgi:xanthine/uracil permease
MTDLIRDLRDESMTLLRQEVALAKTEISEKVSRVGSNSAQLGVGGAIAYAGLLFLLVAATAGLYAGLVALDLSHMTAGWLAPLIIGAVVGLIGYAMVQKALNVLKNEPLVPERTAESLRDDKEWLERKVR